MGSFVSTKEFSTRNKAKPSIRKGPFVYTADVPIKGHAQPRQFPHYTPKKRIVKYPQLKQ